MFSCLIGQCRPNQKHNLQTESLFGELRNINADGIFFMCDTLNHVRFNATHAIITALPWRTDSSVNEYQTPSVMMTVS